MHTGGGHMLHKAPWRFCSASVGLDADLCDQSISGLWYLSNSEKHYSVSLVKGLVWMQMFSLGLFIRYRPGTSTS